MQGRELLTVCAAESLAVSLASMIGSSTIIRYCRGGRQFNIVLRLAALLFLLVVSGPMLPKKALAAGCFRYASGSRVSEPEDLYSHDGVLTVSLSYQTSIDSNGDQLFCYVLPDGSQSPTLHIKPGDRLVLTLTNATPEPEAPEAMRMQMQVPSSTDICGSATMDMSSTNVHFHGTNTPPVCHQDEVIHTLINSGETFTYDVHFPSDEPPGEYWYHPHAHGLSEMAVLGGATGVIIVEGIENLQPRVSGLRQRILVVRDSTIPGEPEPPAPAKDLSLNYVPIPYPDYPPAIIRMGSTGQEFWRVANTSADTILDLQVQYDGRAQVLQVVALDGVPVGSQDGTRQGKIVSRKDILLPPASRAEFLLKPPGKNVSSAQLVTLNVNTGPDGDNDPARPLATIETASGQNPERMTLTPLSSGVPNRQRFEGLAAAQPTAQRKLYFSEDTENFFITVDGQTPVAFSPDLPPAITTTQGAVEDWTIENRSRESHEFHIHQIHFLLLQRNGKPVSGADRQFLDTVDVPFWTGRGHIPP
jgi:FtsP/CotA-like multicopper oxidase with cupredoxin domain